MSKMGLTVEEMRHSDATNLCVTTPAPNSTVLFRRGRFAVTNPPNLFDAPFPTDWYYDESMGDGDDMCFAAPMVVDGQTRIVRIIVTSSGRTIDLDGAFSACLHRYSLDDAVDSVTLLLINLYYHGNDATRSAIRSMCNVAVENEDLELEVDESLSLTPEQREQVRQLWFAHDLGQTLRIKRIVYTPELVLPDEARVVRVQLTQSPMDD